MRDAHAACTRRHFLRISTAAAAGAALGPLRVHGAEQFPDHKLSVIIPTRQGGAADSFARTFAEVWKKHIGANFDFEFYPGAAGEVGYELYLGKKAHDGYNLLFGNMGPEIIMYVTQHPPYNYPKDYFYFCRTDVDDSVVFVPKDSPYKDLKQLVDDARKKTVNVATSRLPHPASIGMLALADATQAKFNLIPYSGGNPTSTAVITGEVPCGVLPCSIPIRLGDQVRVLGVFSDENKLAADMGNAPSVNKVFGTHIPDLPSAHAWGIDADVLTKYPDRFQKIDSTARAVFSDPQFKAVFEKTKVPWGEIQYGDREACQKYAQTMIDLAKRYSGVISAARKKS